MTPSELKPAHAAAGARYAAAIAELRDAYIELAVLDQVVRSVLHGGREDMVRSFFELPQHLAHPVFSPVVAPAQWRGEISARRDQILKGFEQ